MKKILSVVLLGFLLTVIACSEDGDPGVAEDNYNREAMLINWADNIIIPGYEAYTTDLVALVEAKDVFLTTSDATNLNALRNAWLEAYISWQRVALFEIGKAEEITLRDFTNIFPAGVAEIEANISTGTFDLTLPSTRDQQGFPTLDYLINGIEASDDAIMNRYANDTALRNYLDVVVNRLQSLASSVLNDWQNGYRDTFVANSGSNTSSSVNKLVNDFMFFYEAVVRAGKIGIPAGVFSSTPLTDRVEALYKMDVSKVLFLTSLQTCIDFFNGKHFNTVTEGESLKSYLNFLNTNLEGELLSASINNQFTLAKSAGNLLSDSFVQQIETNNQAMLQTYDALQAAVILLKVDMFQALNIRVDFVDADGD